MAFKLVMGKQRSGKSYFMVYHAVKNYFNEVDGKFILKDKYKDVVIVTNIENFQLPHRNLDDWIKHAGGVEKFFSLEWQKKLENKYPHIVYLIDEAQFYFPPDFRHNPVFNWIEYHAHMGQDIYMATHTRQSMAPRFYGLTEFNYEALPRSKSLFGGKDLNYNIVSGTEIIDKKQLIKRKKIFQLYRSQNREEVEKVRNPLMKYMAMIFVALVFFGWRFYQNFYGDSSNHDSSAYASTQQSNHTSQPVKTVIASQNNQPSEPEESYSWVPVSTITMGPSLFIVYKNNLVHFSELPYRMKLDRLRQYYLFVPESQVNDFSSQPDNQQPETPHQDKQTAYM